MASAITSSAVLRRHSLARTVSATRSYRFCARCDRRHDHYRSPGDCSARRPRQADVESTFDGRGLQPRPGAPARPAAIPIVLTTAFASALAAAATVAISDTPRERFRGQPPMKKIAAKQADFLLVSAAVHTPTRPTRSALALPTSLCCPSCRECGMSLPTTTPLLGASRAATSGN